MKWSSDADHPKRFKSVAAGHSNLDTRRRVWGNTCADEAALSVGPPERGLRVHLGAKVIGSS